MNKALYFVLALLSTSLFAGGTGNTHFGRVVDVKGSGFISFGGKTRELRAGDAIEMGAEIVIEHQGQVSFTDNSDHRFFLGNSSSAKVSGSALELREGDLWFQSLNKEDQYRIQTANATIDYTGGEAILSYDGLKGRSQLMVINGIMKISNLRAQELNLSVAEGHFSFVENSYDDGAPRDPTPVGEKTYTQLVSLFKGVAPLDKNSINIFKSHPETASRGVASVKESATHDKAVEIDHSMIEEYKNALLSKKKIHKKVVTNKPKQDNLPKKNKVVAHKLEVHIYGLKAAPVITVSEVAHSSDIKSETKSRAPASVPDAEPANVATEQAPNTAPYSKNYQDYVKESDKLIDDLNKL